MKQVGKEKDDCEYCYLPMADVMPCNASWRGSYRCSREKGHDGPHVACGTDLHELRVWKDEPE